MRETAKRILRRFSRDESGNIFILFGLTLVPLVVIMGGAVDLSRYNHYKMKLSNAVDAAGLALVRKEQERGEEYSQAEARQFVVDYVQAMAVWNDKFTPASHTVTRTENGYAVDVIGTVDNLFLPLAELRSVEKTMDTTDVGIDAEFVRSAQNIELALVLDVTGSMAGSKINDLKDAAKNLVDIIVQPPERQNFYYSKVAIVPYSMGVNLGSRASKARGNVRGPVTIQDAYWRENPKDIDRVENDRPIEVDVEDHGFSNGDIVYFQGVRRMSGMNGQFFVVADKSEDSFELRTSWGGYTDGRDYDRWGRDGYDGTVAKCATTDCDIVIEGDDHGFETGDRVYITDVSGLSDLNGREFDVTRLDDDHFRLNGTGPTNQEYWSGGKAWCLELGCDYYRFRNAEWNWTRHRVSTCVSERTGSQAYTDASPATAKVGWAYPGDDNPCLSSEVMPLTSSIPNLKAKVNSLPAVGSTAGQIGIGWGWYMVSPNFNSLWSNSANKAAAYNAPYTVKVVVLMTDGEFNTPYCDGVVAADAGSGSGQARYHINCNATNGDPFEQAEALCDGMKDKGVIVYTVGFALGWGDSKDVMEYCATSPEHVYLPSSGTELRQAFSAIAEDVNTLRIAR